MSVIDPEGLFNGDRLRRCSNAAQLHWPRLFLASDGFARLEINYARIIGRAYPTFNPVPSETEVQAWLQEYAENYLLFLYEVDGQLWGQWDTRADLLPRYKTAQDRRSPIPPEPAFTNWKRSYRAKKKAFPKCCGSIPATFPCGGGVGVGVGVGKNTCASPDGDARGCEPCPDGSPRTTEAGAPSPGGPDHRTVSQDLADQQEAWFSQWWPAYPRHTAKQAARKAFANQIRTEARFQEIMAATRAQTPQMLQKEEKYRPHGASWLNGRRWEDETAPPPPAAAQDDYPELPA